MNKYIKSTIVCIFVTSSLTKSKKFGSISIRYCNRFLRNHDNDEHFVLFQSELEIFQVIVQQLLKQNEKTNPKEHILFLFWHHIYYLFNNKYSCCMCFFVSICGFKSLSNIYPLIVFPMHMYFLF